MTEQTITDAIRALEEARDLLLRSSQRAGSSHDWPAARKLIDLAEQAGKLLDAVADLQGTDSPPMSVPQTVREARQGIEAPLKPRRAGQRGEYPRFNVRGGVLVKTGLQRDGRGVYEHTVPREQFDRFLGQLKSMAASRIRSPRKPFKAEDVQAGVTAPEYMVFIVLSLLMREGLIQRIRRGAYVFPAPEGFAASVAGLWERLQSETSSTETEPA